MSTDYNPEELERFDSYSKEVITLCERWHTCFCVYKRDALRCKVSHAYHEEIVSGPVRRRKAWDSAAYFQKALKEEFGYKLAALGQEYQSCFIHYGAFSKNRQINEKNIGLYRCLQIWKKRGFFGDWSSMTKKFDDLFTKRLARRLDKWCFGKVDRSENWPGWGKR
jgi:hypothetical protein